MARGVETLLAESKDLLVLNLTVANDACGYDAKLAAQSEAVQLLEDRIALRHVRVLGGQDTIYGAGPPGSRQYFLQSYVNGTCDSIYGSSSMVFDRCTIAISDHVTAAAGATFPWEVDRGSRSVILFFNSSLVKPPRRRADEAAVAAGKTELGRPWRSMAATVYRDVWMDDHIAPYGWGDWGHGCSDGPDGGANCLENRSCWCQNVTYVEYGSRGPGAGSPTKANNQRVKWAHQLSSDDDPVRGRLGLAGTTPRAVCGIWEPPFNLSSSSSSSSSSSGDVVPPEAQWPADPLLPPWPPTYNMSLSTIMQPCNYSDFLEPSFASKFGIVDIDWSNNKDKWANAHPMDSEALMVEQASRLKQHNPQSRPWVYRNLVKALPWFRVVREKLADPAYSGFFLKFRPRNGTNTSSPRCDDNFSPPRCTEFYHDDWQTPRTKGSAGWDQDLRNGVCSPDPCDCGDPSVPAGEYLWDHRNGTMLRDWLMEHYVGGPTGVDHPAISGMFFDDAWGPRGPTEERPSSIADMGLSTEDVAEIIAGWKLTMAAAHHRVVQSQAFDWQLLNCPVYPDMAGRLQCGGAPVSAPERDTLDPKPTCTAWMRKHCGAHSPFQRMALMFGVTRASHDNPLFPQNLSLPYLKQDVATFLLVRGPYAWLGYGWQGCASNFNKPGAFPGNSWRESGYEWSSELLEADYGEPDPNNNTECHETVPGESEVFVREWSKATVTLDCKTFSADIKMKKEEEERRSL
eukprot:g3127.t1